MEWEAYIAIGVAVFLVVGLAIRLATVEMLAITSLAIILLAQHLMDTTLLPNASEAVAGFGNSNLVAIGLLFAVVAGLEYTGGTELATGWLLRKARTLNSAQVRLLAPVAFLSAFLNNTPLVAAMIPVVGDLSKRVGVSSSRLLLPLSYATIIGGMATLMGTSTNLLVAGAYNMTEAGKLSPMGFFAPSPIGIPVAVLGVLYMIIATKWLLPDRNQAVSASDDPRKYTAEVQVEAGGPLVGKTIDAAGLRNLQGLYIAEIQRADGTIHAAKPNEKLQANDVLILVGNLESVVDLRKIRGLVTGDDQARKLQVPAWKRTLVEAVVSPRCELLGKTIREGNFRSHYNAAVVAVARGDKKLEGKLGDVELEVGDVLLLEASPSFLHRRNESRDFFLVSQVDGAKVLRPERAYLAIGILLAMVVASASGIPIVTAAIVAAVMMIGFRCCTSGEAVRSVDWNVLIVIGAAFAVGLSLEKSGAAAFIAGQLVSFAGDNKLLVLAMIYLTTAVTTEMITNNAAALLMLGIATETGKNIGIDPQIMALAVMIAASASFLTPFGYQTNTMVYTVGGYRPLDYVRFGLPLSFIVFAVTMVVLGSRLP